jgi:PAS domain S-box-containing protein
VAEASIGTPAQWKLILEKPIAPFQKALNESYTRKLNILLFMLLATMALAELISRKIVKPLDQLGALTSEFPAKLSRGSTDLAWPESSFQESTQLIHNFKEMADSLSERFRESTEAKEVLELRVQERTHEVQRLNLDFVHFLEGTTDFIHFKDHQGRIRFCSQPFAEITGHRHWKELVGKNAFEIFPEDLAKISLEQDLAIYREGKPIMDKVEVVCDPRGKRGWISTSKWPVFDADHKVVGIFGISRDITDITAQPL